MSTIVPPPEGTQETIALGSGDEFDIAAGRCCPHCRHMLTEHNVAVWNAGYSTGARHTRELGEGRP